MRVFFIFLFSIFLGVAASFAYFLFSINETLAAPLSLSISPPIIEIIAEAPADIKALIKLTNEANEPVSLKIKFIPFIPQGETGEVEFLNLELPIQNLLNVVDEKTLLPLTDLTLRPKESKNLSLHLSLPGEFEPADNYFSVVFLSRGPQSESKPLKETIEAYSEILAGVATNVLLSIRNRNYQDDVRALKIIEFSSPRFLQNGPVSFQVRLKNEGQHFLKPEGKILITNMFGQKIGQLDLPPGNILANSTRAYPRVIFPETFLLGPYLAELKIDSRGVETTAKTTFYAFPAKQFFGGMLLVVIVLITTSRIKKRLGR